jgi:hypothetical protein
MKKQFSRSALSVETKEEEEEEKEKEELRKMDLAVVRVGAGSLARVNGRVTKRERERGGEEGERRVEYGERDGEERKHDREANLCGAFSLRMHGARSAEPEKERGKDTERERERERERESPSGIFKARNVAPSRGMRQSIITVLHIDTTVHNTG